MNHENVAQVDLYMFYPYFILFCLSFVPTPILVSKYVSRHYILQCNFIYLNFKKAGLASRSIVLNIPRRVSLAVLFDFSPFHFSSLADHVSCEIQRSIKLGLELSFAVNLVSLTESLVKKCKLDFLSREQ